MIPRISVIMPVLNGEKYIKEALQSVLDQSFTNFEVIVVDAGSTDGTLDILESVKQKDSRVNILHSDKKSMGYQYNLGIETSIGEYLAFLESDDYIATNMFGELLKKADDFQLDWIKADFCMYLDSDVNGRVYLDIRQGENFLRRNNLYGKVLNPNDYPNIILYDANHWKGIYRREFINKNNIKFNTTKGAAYQDTGFVQQTIIYSNRCMYLDDFFYFYRRDNIECSTVSPKGVMYYYDEFNYMNSIYKQRANSTDEGFIRASYIRAFGMLFSQMEKLPDYSIRNAEVENAITKFYKDMRIGIDKGIIAKKDFSIERWKDFLVLEKNQEIFERYYQIKIECRNEEYIEHLIEIKKQKQVVVCGYGNNGKQYEVFLLTNNYQGEIFVCDNDANMTSTRNGKKIYKFEECTEVVGNKAIYIISVKSKGAALEINKQLVDLGIMEKQIMNLDIEMNPYIATMKFIYEVNKL